MFQHVGGAAYKEGLENTQVLDKHFGHPHHSFRTIHVAGTNGYSVPTVITVLWLYMRELMVISKQNAKSAGKKLFSLPAKSAGCPISVDSLDHK